jgi:hypothetical protein
MYSSILCMQYVQRHAYATSDCSCVLLFALLLQNGIVLVTRMVKPSNLASSSDDSASSRGSSSSSGNSSSSSSGSSSSAANDKAASVHMALRVDVTASEVRVPAWHRCYQAL